MGLKYLLMGVKQIIQNRRFYMLLAVAFATFGIIGYASFAGTGTNAKTENIISSARSKINTEFFYGAEGESKFDSSGFVYWVFEKQNGLKLANTRGTATDYFNAGREIAKDQLKKGDLVFFSYNNKEASQIGIYVDGNNFITASQGYGKVTVLSFNSHLANPSTHTEDTNRKTYNDIYIGARRVIGVSSPLVQVDVFKRGDEKTEIQSLQQDLNTIGYHVAKTGIYDEQTEAAVKSLEESYGANQDGAADGQVMAVITELKNARIARILIP